MSAGDQQQGSTHYAMFYGSDEDYVTSLLPFIGEGVSRGEPVAVAVPARNLELLTLALGDLAFDVRMLDMTHFGRNPGRIIGLIDEIVGDFGQSHPERTVRYVGEPIWAGRSDAEYEACVRHEALINEAFAGRGVSIVCPYDTVRLDDSVLADARATHPLLWGGAVSREYAPVDVLERSNQPISVPPHARTLVIASVLDLGSARRFAAQTAGELGVGADRFDDVLLVVNELVTNSLMHTNGSCELRMWRAGEQLVCATADSGHLPRLLTGYLPAEQPTGLRLVHQLADLVRIHVTAGGTTVNAFFGPSSTRDQLPVGPDFYLEP
ncbi:sensor histidine kinase [Skermania sp. ID1734]|uniref:sensor histidine kinase n=1 Tax=Skermania sp. ID1734 TaxID=2597516 RepID=UPI00117E0DC8|nr:sensor histidine kinase [Skermania sp. ID1734]TSD99492.1 sensor histidine kinase [Skermania sp. ID1734]